MSIQATPISGALGAEITGINLAENHSDEVTAQIREALLEHQVIFFRGQEFTPEQQIRFAQRFGQLEEHDFVKGLPDHPEIIRVVREADETSKNFGGNWHSDVT
ncbi:MAG: TauD/TfdA dioxygenase family protein, partial [Limisphaerales bacterium]